MQDTGNETCSHVYTLAEADAIWGTTLFSAILSFIGSLFILFTYALFPSARSFPYKLICFLSLADLGSSLAYFIGLSVDYRSTLCSLENACIVSAIFTQFFDVATFFWTGCVAITIYFVIVRDMGRKVEELEKYYHLVCWGIPGIFAIICGALGVYGDAGLWCWLIPSAQLERFLFYYFPLLFILLMNFLFMIRIHIFFKVSSGTFTTTATSRIRLYVFIFAFIRIWSIIDRVIGFFAPQDPVFFIGFLHAFFSPLQGFANALVYGCNSVVISQWVKCCSRSNRDVQVEFIGNDDINERRQQEEVEMSRGVTGIISND